MASVAQMVIIMADVLAANHKFSDARQKVIMLTSIAFDALVAKAGLSEPLSVGNITGKNISCQIVVMVSCHINAYDYI